MSAWAVVGILAGLFLAFLGLFALVDWIYMRCTVSIARKHYLKHSKFLYPED